ncbi:golgin subfamily A member 6-like protein 26 [Ptychodera flava]|uniref:golgin subfamily A member 6-like protein 26 n=1 Tax=Ptychodera flava TaxID=63121 RepID=UPI00396A6D74
MQSRNSTLTSRQSSSTEELEGPSKNTLMRRQFAEFRGKLESGSKNFSKETLHYWLKTLTDKQEISYQNKFITSIGHLRKLVNWVTGRYKNAKKRKEEDKELLAYFEWFFGYIDYLRELRKSFEYRIYNPLFDYFLDDEADCRKSDDDDDEDLAGDGKVTPDNQSPDSGLGNESMLENAFKQPSVSQVLVQLSREFSDINFKLDNKDLNKTAKELHTLVKKWRGIIDSDREIDAHNYSKESLEEVAPYSNIGHFRQFLRLVPDVLFKAGRALGLAEHWMDLDDQRMQQVDKQLQLVEEIQTRLELRVIDVLSKLQRHQVEFNLKSDELQMLLQREDRSNELNVKMTFIQADIDSLSDKLRDAYKTKDDIISELRNLKQAKKEHTEEYRDCTDKYDDNERHIKNLESRVQLEEYKYRLVEEDMFVELEVKPSIVRYTNQVEDQCERLEQYLKEEKEQRRKLERALKPLSLKTGRDVTEIMNIVDSNTSASQSTVDLQAASSLSSHVQLNDKVKELESVYEDDELPDDGAVASGLSLPPVVHPESPVRVSVERREDVSLPPVQPDKKVKQRSGEKESSKTLEKERGKKRRKQENQENLGKENWEISGWSDNETRNSKTPAPVKNDKPKKKVPKAADKKKELNDKKKQTTKQPPAKPQKGPTKTIAKKPIVKPKKSRSEPAKKVAPKVQRPPRPANEPKVELPWYRRQILLQRQNVGQSVRDREPIRSRDNLEWMYRQAAERQGVEFDIVSGTQVSLQQRYPRPPSRRLRKMPSGLSFL